MSPSSLRDTYGYAVRRVKNGRTLVRHAQCRCEVPCQERYDCQAPGHRGRRSTPWCCGAADDEPYWCDACWARKHNRTPPRRRLRGI